MRNLTILLLLAFSLSVNADIYKFYDENGNVVYTDHPEVGAEKIKTQQLQTISTPPAPEVTPEENAEKPFAYRKVEISSPENDATVRDNNGVINVDLQLEPSLKTKLGHKVSLLLDGKAMNEPAPATSFTLDGVDRGQHTISASITDKKGNEIAVAPAITVYMKRFSIQHPKPANTPQVPAVPPANNGSN